MPYNNYSHLIGTSNATTTTSSQIYIAPNYPIHFVANPPPTPPLSALDWLDQEVEKTCAQGRRELDEVGRA